MPLGDNDYEPARLIGAVLAAVLREALNQHDHHPPAGLLLTHPVVWRKSRIQVLRDALRWAATDVGVEQLPAAEFLAEPVAAAHWFAHPDPSREGQRFAVYDLGGGTFDAAVLQQSGGSFVVLGSGGLDPLGGFDFDNLLFDYLGQRHIAEPDPALWAQLSQPDPEDPKVRSDRRTMQERVKILKEQLSVQPTAHTRLPGLTHQVQVTREEYARLISAPVGKTVDKLKATIANAGLEVEQLSAVYRIGGAARTPLVGDALNALRVPVRSQDHPKLVVAEGGAVVVRQTMLTAPPQPPPDPDRESGGHTTGEQTHDHGPHVEERHEFDVRKRAEDFGQVLQNRARSTLDKLRETQDRFLDAQSAARSDTALQTRLAAAGIDSRRAYWSRLGLRSPQTSVARTMVIDRARLGVHGQFEVCADKGLNLPRLNLRTSNFSLHMQHVQDALQKSGWTFRDPQPATVAGVPGSARWRSMTTAAGEHRQVLHGFAQLRSYMIDAWLDEAQLDHWNALYVHTSAGASALTSRLASSTSVAIVADRVDHERIDEHMCASVNIAGRPAVVTAELSAVGRDPDAIGEAILAEMEAREGRCRSLLVGEPDVFFGDKPCRQYRFEWQAPDVNAPKGYRPPVSNWVWVGALEGRAVTIEVESQTPAVPADAFRDLVDLAPSGNVG